MSVADNKGLIANCTLCVLATHIDVPIWNLKGSQSLQWSSAEFYEQWNQGSSPFVVGGGNIWVVCSWSPFTVSWPITIFTNGFDFHFGYYSLQLRNICGHFFSLLTIFTVEVALNLPTTPFLFVLSNIFHAARAIKSRSLRKSSKVGKGNLKLPLHFLCGDMLPCSINQKNNIWTS